MKDTPIAPIAPASPLLRLARVARTALEVAAEPRAPGVKLLPLIGLKLFDQWRQTSPTAKAIEAELLGARSGYGSPSPALNREDARAFQAMQQRVATGTPNEADKEAMNWFAVAPGIERVAR